MPGVFFLSLPILTSAPKPCSVLAKEGCVCTVKHRVAQHRPRGRQRDREKKQGYCAAVVTRISDPHDPTGCVFVRVCVCIGFWNVIPCTKVVCAHYVSVQCTLKPELHFCVLRGTGVGMPFVSPFLLGAVLCVEFQRQRALIMIFVPLKESCPCARGKT